MKALMLAAVMALGGTGASALDSYELLQKGTVIATVGANSRVVWLSYKGAVYACVSVNGLWAAVKCAKTESSKVK